MRILASALVALGLAAPGAATAGPIANGQGWTGFYGGVHVGGARPSVSGIYDTGDIDGIAVDMSDLEDWAFIGGGQIGYDMQVGRTVIGIVGDFSYLGYDANASDSGGGWNDNSVNASADWIASIRVRGGYPVADFMPYFTIGAAYTEVELSHTPIGPNAGSDLDWNTKEDDWGYVAGFGIDWAAFQNVTVGAEALFYGFDMGGSLAGQPDAEAGDFVDFDRMWNFRLTANYRF